MRYRIVCVLAIALGLRAALASAEPPDFNAVKRASYQAPVVPRGSMAPMPSQPVVAEPVPVQDENPVTVYDGNEGEPYFAGNGCGCNYSSCGSCCNNCFSGCCGSRCGVWGQIEALGWWVRGSQAPPLVSTDSLPQGTILFPNNDLDQQARAGGRVTLGCWLDSCQTEGFNGNFFSLGRASTDYNAVAVDGGPTIGRPFTDYSDPTTPTPEFLNLITAGVATGRINVHTTSDLMGAEANYQGRLWCNRCAGNRVDFIGGYRFLRFNESLSVSTNQLFQQPSTIDSIAITDMFGTRNQFNGGQIGLIWHKQCCRWGLNLIGKLAFGGLNQQVTIQGTTTNTPTGQSPTTLQGGVLALASNSGTYTRNVFSFIPELNANLAYQLNCCWTLRVGYTLFFVSNVARPGDQIDTNLNSNQFPPSVNTNPPPTFTFNDSYIWVQGINLGAELRF